MVLNQKLKVNMSCYKQEKGFLLLLEYFISSLLYLLCLHLYKKALRLIYYSIRQETEADGVTLCVVQPILGSRTVQDKTRQTNIKVGLRPILSSCSETQTCSSSTKGGTDSKYDHKITLKFLKKTFYFRRTKTRSNKMTLWPVVISYSTSCAVVFLQRNNFWTPHQRQSTILKISFSLK